MADVEIDVTFTPAELSLVLMALDDLITGWALNEQHVTARNLRARLSEAERAAYRKAR